MGVLQSECQQSIRALTGTAGTVEGDFYALFDQESVPAGTFNERLKAWADQRLALGTPYPDIMGSLNAYAVVLGFDAWNNVNNIPAAGGVINLQIQASDGAYLVASDASPIVTAS